jgi:hypothetical protein
MMPELDGYGVIRTKNSHALIASAPKSVMKTFYCARGNMENQIKQQYKIVTTVRLFVENGRRIEDEANFVIGLKSERRLQSLPPWRVTTQKLEPSRTTGFSASLA